MDSDCQNSTSSLWRRQRPNILGGFRASRNNLLECFDAHVDANIDLDIDTKCIALRVSPSVVCIASLTMDDWAFFFGSGIIIESEDVSGTYISTILTSASAIRSTELDNVVEDNIKIYALLPDGKYEGEIVNFDFHYNVATIRIKSDVSLPTATLRLLDDSRSIFPSEGGSSGSKGVGFQLHPHSDLCSICPKDKVVAIGRSCTVPHCAMAAPGRFSLECCELDCVELLRANCIISKTGIGGPLVNQHGEVIGMNFYDIDYTPFLPINIVIKCLECFKRYGKFCRPSLGMQMTNLYASSLDQLEGFVHKFPRIFKGVVVEKVTAGSVAESAGIQCNDVIVQCGGTVVQGFLELHGIIMDNVGKSIEMLLMRSSSGEHLKLILDVYEASPDEFYRWPLPEECLVFVDSVR